MPLQVASSRCPFWATPTVSRVSARTAAALSAVRSATAAAGSSTVVVTSAGRISSPTAALSGKAAVIRTVAGCCPEGRAQT
ncbi:hypothetical protein O1L60_38325 [Streptomyces diastatochromogenes]|nr:hypothetical protein [Streptomyces diastatochromogenes]